MADDWDAVRMRELGMRHAILETKGDIEGTMATLIETPVYDFMPMRLRMVGQENVRRYYRHLSKHFVTNTSHAMVEEWVTPVSVAQEYDIVWDPKGTAETHRVLGILFRAEGTELLGGERIYASERCARLMLGDALYDELVPMDD